MKSQPNLSSPEKKTIVLSDCIYNAIKESQGIDVIKAKFKSFFGEMDENVDLIVAAIQGGKHRVSTNDEDGYHMDYEFFFSSEGEEIVGESEPGVIVIVSEGDNRNTLGDNAVKIIIPKYPAGYGKPQFEDGAFDKEKGWQWK